jgi:hypothetical protein
MDVCFLWVVCCQIDVSVSCWSFVQRSPTECGVSKVWSWSLDNGRPWPTRGCHAI